MDGDQAPVQNRMTEKVKTASSDLSQRRFMELRQRNLGSARVPS